MHVISLIICFLYLFSRIDSKQFSWPIFLLCLIYSSFFVTLNNVNTNDIILFIYTINNKINTQEPEIKNNNENTGRNYLNQDDSQHNRGQLEIR